MTTGSLLTRVRSKIQHTPKSSPSKPPPSKPQEDEEEAHPHPQPDPIIDNDDEVFLNRVLSESLPTVADVPAEAYEKDEDTQAESIAAAQKTPLPPTPPSESPERSRSADQDGSKADNTRRKSDSKWTPKRLWDTVKRSRSTRNKDANKEPHKPSEEADAGQPKDDAPNAGETETKQEENDMAQVLDKLNLAATDNRVFSINEEMQSLLKKFKLILKDLLNGAPTAYNDLESLLKHRDKQLEQLFDSLPKFLQKLIAHLPEKLAPEVLAAAAAKAESSGMSAESVETAGKAASATAKMGLKDLVTKPAAITGVLRSIVAFLRARFPALMGVNVLWSLAICLLLLVLWYCHKRGREVRLEKERSDAAAEEKEEKEEGDGTGDEKASPGQGPATSGETPPVAEARSVEGGGGNGAAVTTGEKRRPKQIEPYEGT